MIWASWHWALAYSDWTILMGFLGQELFQDQAEVSQWCKKKDHLWVWRAIHLRHRLRADTLKPWSPRHPCYDDSPLHLPLGTAELCMLHSTGSIPGSVGLFPKSHQTQSRVSSPGLCSKNELCVLQCQGVCLWGKSEPVMWAEGDWRLWNSRRFTSECRAALVVHNASFSVTH